MADEIPVFPVPEWEIQLVPSRQAALIRIAFLSHPLQRTEEADPGRRYAFQLPQLRELQEAMGRAIAKLETSDAPPTDTPPH